jgi:hypothetical protein
LGVRHIFMCWLQYFDKTRSIDINYFDMYDEQQYLNALHAYMRAKPQKFEKSFFKDYQTVIQYSGLLIHSSFDEKFITRILDIIQPSIDNNRRFKRKWFIKFLKSHVKKRPKQFKFKETTTNALFKFYKTQILKVTDELANDLSVILKDIELSDESINWLIDNAHKSKYVLNRLLRYPKKSKLISTWASYCLDNKLYVDRLSEIIGFVLDANENLDLNHTDKNQIVWGIYYSRLGKETKEKILIELLSPETIDSIIEISERLKLYKVFENILK